MSDLFDLLTKLIRIKETRVLFLITGTIYVITGRTRK